MATTKAIGAPQVCDFERSEDDTDDITVRLRDSSGTLIDTADWTGTFNIGPDNDSNPTASFNGVGSGVDGLIIFDFSGFTVPVSDNGYKYDIRLTDTGPTDNPSRVYFKGKFKVTPRIN